MAERRMFSSTVLNMGKFIALPMEAQLLYMRLNLMADDEGFLDSPVLACRVTGTAEQQVQALENVGFLIRFPNGPTVITHWHVHNKLRKDRKKQTLYLEYLQRLTVDESGVYHMAEDAAPVEPKPEQLEQPEKGPESVEQLFAALCPSLEPCKVLAAPEKKQADKLGMEYLERLFRKAEQTPFLCGQGPSGWRAGLPWLLTPGNGDKVLGGKFDAWRKKVPKGATGQLGAVELAAIQRALKENFGTEPVKS